LSADINAAHDKILSQCAAAIVDITSMQLQVLTLWREDISVMLAETPETDDVEEVNLEGIISTPHLGKINDQRIQSCITSDVVQVDVACPFAV
jgi:hypothetical protein